MPVTGSVCTGGYRTIQIPTLFLWNHTTVQYNTVIFLPAAGQMIEVDLEGKIYFHSDLIQFQ